MQEQAAWARNATTNKNDTCIEKMDTLDAIAKLLPLLSHSHLISSLERFLADRVLHVQEQAAWALNALTSKNDTCIEDMVSLDAPAKLLPLLSNPETWNWTPVVSTMKNLSGGPQQAQHALVRADAMTVFLEILSFGRPTLQVTFMSALKKP